jgi:hypothetical protein
LNKEMLMKLTARPNLPKVFTNAAVNQMRYPAFILSLVVTLAFAASPALATPITAAGQVTVDGVPSNVPMSFAPELGIFGVGTWNSGTESFSGFDLTTEAGDQVHISGALDPDPAISYSIGVTDFGAPSVFGFFFSSPIVVPAGPTSVNASISGGLTDFSGNGVTITPTGALLQISSVGPPVTNMGVDVGPTVSGGPGLPGANYTYGAFGAGPIAGPAGPWTTLSITLGFSLSGGNDSAALTGFAQIVPEPSSVFMLGAGVLGLLYFARRRQK